MADLPDRGGRARPPCPFAGRSGPARNARRRRSLTWLSSFDCSRLREQWGTCCALAEGSADGRTAPRLGYSRGPRPAGFPPCRGSNPARACLPAREDGLLAADCCVVRVSPAWRRPPGRPGPAGVRQIGEVRLPILSVVSSGTLVPFRKRLSRLNQAIMATYLRVVATPKVSSSAVSVSSVRVWAWESSSVARQISTYSGSMPVTEPSEAAAEMSASLSPALPAIVAFACHS